MQPALNNAEKQTEKKWDKAKDTIEQSVSDIKSLSKSDIKDAAVTFGNRVRDMSSGFFSDSMDLVKRYPVGSALSLAAMGFLAGTFTAKMRK